MQTDPLPTNCPQPLDYNLNQKIFSLEFSTSSSWGHVPVSHVLCAPVLRPPVPPPWEPPNRDLLRPAQHLQRPTSTVGRLAVGGRGAGMQAGSWWKCGPRAALADLMEPKEWLKARGPVGSRWPQNMSSTQRWRCLQAGVWGTRVWARVPFSRACRLPFRVLEL
jgi:hypothetical protein